MKCNLENREGLISKYLMNELSDEESLKFEEHYFMCKDCFQELKAAEDAINIIAKDGPASFEKIKTQSAKSVFSFIPSFSFPVKIGFTFTGFALLFALYFLFKNNSTDNYNTQKTITQTQDDENLKIDSSKNTEENPIKKNENLIAELSGPAFNPNTYYEEWINENVRSGNNLIERVIEPKNGIKTYDDLTFKWVMKENAKIQLSILDNLESKIYSIKISKDDFPEITQKVSADSFKKSGLYYWRIEDENEVLFVGKFYFFKNR
jgi:hypothetical protein